MVPGPSGSADGRVVAQLSAQACLQADTSAKACGCREKGEELQTLPRGPASLMPSCDNQMSKAHPGLPTFASLISRVATPWEVALRSIHAFTTTEKE